MKPLLHRLIWLALLLPVAQAIAADPGVADTVRIGCPIRSENIVEGDSIAIPFYLWNDENVQNFTLGFHYNSDLVEITSWSMTGSVVPPEARMFKFTTSLPALNLFLASWLDFYELPFVPPTPGSHGLLLGTLYMRVLPGAVPHVVDLDSAFVPPGGHFQVGIAVSPGIITPQYVDCGTNDIWLGAIYDCGDVNGSDIVDIGDAVYLASYIFAAGEKPKDLSGGDVNCDGRVNLTDAVYLIVYSFAGGPAPCAGCW